MHKMFAHLDQWDLQEFPETTDCLERMEPKEGKESQDWQSKSLHHWNKPNAKPAHLDHLAHLETLDHLETLVHKDKIQQLAILAEMAILDFLVNRGCLEMLENPEAMGQPENLAKMALKVARVKMGHLENQENEDLKDLPAVRATMADQGRVAVQESQDLKDHPDPLETEHLLEELAPRDNLEKTPLTVLVQNEYRANDDSNWKSEQVTSHFTQYSHVNLTHTSLLMILLLLLEPLQ